MSDNFISLSDMTDSRELLEARPPRVISVFVYLLFGILVISFLWIFFSSIEITIKVPGLLRPVKDSSIGRNLVSGKIKALYFENGDYVSSGDSLYEIDSESFERERETLLESFAKADNKQKNLQLLFDSVGKEVNLFKPENEEYYHRYLSYILEKEKYKLNWLQAKHIYDEKRDYPEGMIAPSELEILDSDQKLAKMSLDAYTSQIIVQIKTEIDSLENEKRNLDLNIEKLKKQIENCNIIASISGYVQKSQEINPGDYISLGTEIYRIFPVNNSLFLVDVFVPNNEIAGISEGDIIRYNFPGLSEKDYGVFEGKIISVPENSLESGEGNGLYLVQGNLDNESKQQNTPLRAGMYCDSRIIVKEQRILDYLLEKLDLKTR